MKIGILGYGKMGKEVEKNALSLGHEIVWKITSANRPLLTIQEVQKADVVIEFTSPENAIDNILLCFVANVPIITGSTGWYDRLDEIKKIANEKSASLFYASNFSIGVHLFLQINAFAAQLMNNYSQYDVAIEETHHMQKKDAPSGTAISTAETILPFLNRKESWELDAEAPQQLNITAHRIENVPGTHIVNYHSAIDSIKIEHIAHNREGFAAGAVKAAEWMMDKKGVFTMQDMLANRAK